MPQCNSGKGCKPNEYCKDYGTTSLCEPCEDCENRFYRQRRTEFPCAKSWLDCGECLNGYVSEDHGNGDFSERCVKKQDEFEEKTFTQGEQMTNSLQQIADKMHNIEVLHGIIMACVLVLAVAQVLDAVSKWRSNSTNDGDPGQEREQLLMETSDRGFKRQVSQMSQKSKEVVKSASCLAQNN